MTWPRFLPRSLFGRTALTLTLAFLVLQLFAFGGLAYYIAVPLGQRATEDLAALMILAAKTWVELPPATRPAFERELKQQHGFIVQRAAVALPDHTSYLPYRLLLEAALQRRLGRPVPVRTTLSPEIFWADVPMAGNIIRIGFARERIGARPPYALVTIFIALTLVIVVTALVLARRLTRPLAMFTAATDVIGHGTAPAPLPETGPLELAQLARRFNRMARQVQELLANRTTLLAGISHDLRTPLARMRLALAMLPQDADPKLLAGVEADVDAMDKLVGQYLELARGLDEDARETLDLRELIDKAVADARRSGAAVRWRPGAPCLRTVSPLAFDRILMNLLDNARRYGGGYDIDVECECNDSGVAVTVFDRGPGIPESERDAVFRPFHRLDHSRSSESGGSGLGLAIALQLAEALEWRIELSERPGGGTEARLVLPGQ